MTTIPGAPRIPDPFGFATALSVYDRAALVAAETANDGRPANLVEAARAAAAEITRDRHLFQRLADRANDLDTTSDIRYLATCHEAVAGLHDAAGARLRALAERKQDAAEGKAPNADLMTGWA